jgi:uncharacterized protein YbjT (DUF2867 family)
MRTILVTGATGNIGAEVVRLLQAQNYPVRAAVRDANRKLATAPDVPTVAFDFTRPERYVPALEGIGRIFLVRPPALSNTRRYVNPFIDAAGKAGVEQIVFLSLLGAEKNRAVPHAAVEQHLQAGSIPWTLLRPGFFMQNLSTIHRAEIRDEDEIIVPAGKGKTSFIDGRDIAAVAVKTLTEPGHTGKAYPLTGAEALSYAEVARIFSEELGRPIRYRNPSIFRFARNMRRRGHPWPFVLVTAAIYTTTRFGLAASITPNTAELLGRPPIDVRRFIGDHRECWIRP